MPTSEKRFKPIEVVIVIAGTLTPLWQFFLSGAMLALFGAKAWGFIPVAGVISGAVVFNVYAMICSEKFGKPWLTALLSSLSVAGWLVLLPHMLFAFFIGGT